MGGMPFNIHNVSPYLGALGLLGTIILLAATAIVMWRYRSSHFNVFCGAWVRFQAPAVITVTSDDSNLLRLAKVPDLLAARVLFPGKS